MIYSNVFILLPKTIYGIKILFMCIKFFVIYIKLRVSIFYSYMLEFYYYPFFKHIYRFLIKKKIRYTVQLTTILYTKIKIKNYLNPLILRMLN